MTDHPRHDEEMVVERLDLRTLVHVDDIFQGKVVQIEQFTYTSHQITRITGGCASPAGMIVPDSAPGRVLRRNGR
jgi:hypothetical protein